MSQNVDAIANALREYVAEIGTIDIAYHDEPDIMRVANWLAAHFCLAVDSLTDEQAGELIADVDWDAFYHGDGEALIPAPGAAEAVRAALRRCATGEAE